MKVRLFSLALEDVGPGMRILAASSLVSTLLSGVLVTSNLLGLTQTWVTEAGPIAPTIMLWVIVAPLSWGFYVLLPLFSLRLTVQNRVLGKVGLSLVALVDFVLLFQGSAPLYWWVNVLLTAGACLSAVLAWPISNAGADRLSGKAPVHRSVTESTRRALILFAVGGLFGLHAIHLRQSWRCLLYVLLLALAFIGSNGPIGIAIVVVLYACVIADFVRLDSEAKSYVGALGPRTSR